LYGLWELLLWKSMIVALHNEMDEKNLLLLVLVLLLLAMDA